MPYARSLRIIGQSFENAKLQRFELETDGNNYLVQIDSLDAASEWILRQAVSPVARESILDGSVRFTPDDISRIDDQSKKQRKMDSSHTQTYRRLSQLLRTLGDYLGRMEVKTFHISWASSSVSVDFQLPDGRIDSRTFTAEKLEQLGPHSRFRRTSRVNTNLRGSVKTPGPRNR
jgi:hypothetical protein